HLRPRARTTGQLGTEAVALDHRARLRARVGEFDEGRRLLKDATTITHDIGFKIGEVSNVPRWIGRLEWLAGDPVAAEMGLRRGYEECARLGATGHMAFIGAELARMLYLQGRLHDALGLSLVAERSDIGC